MTLGKALDRKFRWSSPVAIWTGFGESRRKQIEVWPGLRFEAQSGVILPCNLSGLLQQCRRVSGDDDECNNRARMMGDRFHTETVVGRVT